MWIRSLKIQFIITPSGGDATHGLQRQMVYSTLELFLLIYKIYNTIYKHSKDYNN